MLTYIKINGFESHNDSHYEFSPHFNLFVGESNAGKSSIIRAICVVCYNRWDEAMLNGKTAEIELGTDKGFVKVRKGKSINDWIVYNKAEDKTYEYHKIGKTIPDKVVEVTGMPEIQWSEITETPNVMFQLDKHYLIAEIDGKKCSANMFARVVDNVLGLGGVEDLIKDISTDGASAKRKCNANQEMIDKLKLKLHDEKDIDGLKGKLNLFVEIKKKQQVLEKVMSFDKQIKQVTETIESCIVGLRKFAGLEIVKSKIVCIKDNCLRIDKLNFIEEQHNKTMGVKALCLLKLAGIGDVVKTSETLRRMKANADIIDKMAGVGKLFSEWSGKFKIVENKIINIPDIKLEFDDVKVKLDKYNRCEAMHKEFSTYNQNVIGTKRKLDETFALFNMFSKQLEELKDEAKICPMCGKSYDEDKHKHKRKEMTNEACKSPEQILFSWEG